MQELHSGTQETTRWLWRALTGFMVIVVFSSIYEMSEELIQAARLAPTVMDMVSAFGGAFIQLGFFVAIGGVAAGFMWGAGRSYVRLLNGYLEYHWFFWEWDCLRKADLRQFTEARIGMHTIRRRGRSYSTPSILFTRRDDAKGNGEGEEYIPLPKGVPEESQQLFLQSVNREIKQIRGGR